MIKAVLSQFGDLTFNWKMTLGTEPWRDGPNHGQTKDNMEGKRGTYPAQHPNQT